VRAVRAARARRVMGGGGGEQAACLIDQPSKNITTSHHQLFSRRHYFCFHQRGRTRTASPSRLRRCACVRARYTMRSARCSGAACILLLVLAVAAAAGSAPPPPPSCKPSSLSPTSDASTGAGAAGVVATDGVVCAAAWHSWCASRVEEFNSRARRDVAGTHVGLWRGKQWRTTIKKLRQAGCAQEWVVPSHPDAWHGLGRAGGGGGGTVYARAYCMDTRSRVRPCK
jgi:hypothetical protein